MKSGRNFLRNVAAIVACLAVVTMLAACGDKNVDTEKTPAATAGKLNPPAWLIGNWANGDPNEDISVTAHNVVVSSGNLDFSYQIERNYGTMSDFQEILNGDVYTLSYMVEIPEHGSIAYTFEPYDNGKMKLTLAISYFGGEAEFIYFKK